LRGWRIGSIGGISIEINSSWIVIFLLVWSHLANGGLGGAHGETGQVGRWVAGFVMALMFFGSVLLHELSHSFTSRAVGVDVKRITLFVFGGVAQMEKEPQTAKHELLISLAGPAMSLLLALVLGGLYWVAGRTLDAPVVGAVLRQVAIANLVLAIFNMAPGFPMDGGRVVRALLWWRWGDIVRATRVASILGQVVGYGLAGLGVVSVLESEFAVGLFNVGMGLLLVTIAKAGYRREYTRAALANLDISALASAPELAFHAGTSLSQALPHLAARQPRGWVPIVLNHRPIGVLAGEAVNSTPASLWPVTPVEHVMAPLREEMVVRQGASAVEVYERLADGGLPEVIVVDELGRFRGVVTRGGLLALLSRRG